MTLAVRRWAIVPAAGQGSRFGAALPKQYAPLLGRPVLSWTLAALLAEPAHRRHRRRARAGRCPLAGLARVFEIRASAAVPAARGASTRSRTGSTRWTGDARDTDWVLVHDAARPCLRRHDLDLLFAALDADAVGGLLAVPVSDTLKREDGDQRAGRNRGA